MLNSSQQADGVVFNSTQIDTALRMSGWGKKSKQHFLKASCTDTTIRSRKGTGGNTVVCHCIIVKQAEVAKKTIEELRKGAHALKLQLFMHSLNSDSH